MTQLNPKVKKLAEQAKGFVDLNQHVGGDNGCMIYTYEGLNNFAELIVRECVDTVQRRYMGDNNREDMEVRRCVEDLKTHFGVD